MLTIVQVLQMLDLMPLLITVWAVGPPRVLSDAVGMAED